jgi:hypothetical protein
LVVATSASARTEAPPQTVELTIPDSYVIDVAQFTLIAFHPMVTDSMLERDEALATVMDDFGHHLSGAMSALRDSGWVVDTRVAGTQDGDTLRFRSGGRTWRWVRPADSAYVGYVLTEPTGRMRAIFGVRTNLDLITVADSFARLSRR